MNKELLLTCVVTLGLIICGTSTFAQWNGAITIFSDSNGLSSCLSPDPGVLYLYFFHVNAIGAVASQWAAPPPACVTATHLTDIPVFAINLGDTETGITIGYTGYPACKTGTFHIMTATYQVASVGECCAWQVVADPNLLSGKIEIPDCDFELTYGRGGTAIFITNPTCCGDPIEGTTWGGVKALYAE